MDSETPLTWLHLLTVVAAVWACYIVYGAIWRLYLSPIAKFPGPKWAALTLWYEFYFDIVKASCILYSFSLSFNDSALSYEQRGQYFKEIDRMHSVYGKHHMPSLSFTALFSRSLTSSSGPIIRINPSEIHVKDPDWYNELYTSSTRRRDKSACSLVAQEGTRFSEQFPTIITGFGAPP